MRLPKPLPIALMLTALALMACAQQAPPAPTPVPTPHNYVGFDSNDYPGDDLLPALRKQFSFTGYWLNNPPGATHNPWVGKRSILLRNGFGFLVAANGRLGSEILKARKAGKSPSALGREDAAVAVAAARREGFPPHTILFLDQEDGGRLLDEQAAYLLAWTEAVAGSAYLPGVYASGMPVPDGNGPDGKPVTITTIQDIRERVARGHLHKIAFWIYDDACPPAPGCIVPTSRSPSPGLSGILNADAWQFAQSPQRKELTQACTASYTNGNCYAPGIPNFALDLSVSTSPDPSHGR